MVGESGWCCAERYRVCPRQWPPRRVVAGNICARWRPAPGMRPPCCRKAHREWCSALGALPAPPKLTKVPCANRVTTVASCQLPGRRRPADLGVFRGKNLQHYPATRHVSVTRVWAPAPPPAAVVAVAMRRTGGAAAGGGAKGRGRGRGGRGCQGRGRTGMRVSCAGGMRCGWPPARRPPLAPHALALAACPDPGRPGRPSTHAVAPPCRMAAAVRQAVLRPAAHRQQQVARRPHPTGPSPPTLAVQSILNDYSPPL